MVEPGPLAADRRLQKPDQRASDGGRVARST